jgi:NAD(P)-dependent dehydrogenase (short-subunit alcohol dehydrogenase family)
MSRSEEQSEGVQIDTKWYDEWIAEEVPDLTGKVAIVTGANSGMGFWIANALASKGCEVILACRDIGKGAAARNAIMEKYGESAKVHALLLDLMEFGSVRAFCTDFLERYDSLHYLINNAAVMATPAEVSIDGHDIQMQTNHLGHFLLTKLLWQRLLDTPGQSRVVQHSCMAYWVNSPIFDREKYPHYSSLGMMNVYGRMVGGILGYKPFVQWMRYGVTKLVNLLFMRELQRKIEERHLTEKVISVAAHGGLAATNIQISSSQYLPKNWKRDITRQGQSAADGSLPLLMACLSPDIENGDFCGPSGKWELTGLPEKVKVYGQVDNEEQAEDMWDYSEDCVQEAFNV